MYECIADAEKVAIATATKISVLHKSGMTSKDTLFRSLVAEHQEMVINTCYRFVFNREDAEDIAQDVFIEVFRSLEQFREESKLSTWIYRIAVTKSLDHLRHLKRKKRFSSLKRIVGFEDPSAEIASPYSENPAETFAGNEQAEILRVNPATRLTSALHLSNVEEDCSREFDEFAPCPNHRRLFARTTWRRDTD